jgi:hypothetical protein
MVHIKKETIIKPGDILTLQGCNDQLEVKYVTGFKIHVIDRNTKVEKILVKNDLLINDWMLTINNRNYW